jgi:hypothetical protein
MINEAMKLVVLFVGYTLKALLTVAGVIIELCATIIVGLSSLVASMGCLGLFVALAVLLLIAM